MGQPKKGRVVRSTSEREIIAYNIQALRRQMYPGHGGASKCAEAYGIALFQWSPWETGRRSPTDERLASIAKFFKVTIEDLKTAPEDWPELREQWLAKKKKPNSLQSANKRFTGNPPKENEAALQQLTHELPDTEDIKSTSTEQAVKDYVEALQVLLDGQERYDQGKIHPDKYSKVMRSIISLVKYGLSE